MASLPALPPYGTTFSFLKVLCHPHPPLIWFHFWGQVIIHWHGSKKSKRYRKVNTKEISLPFLFPSTIYICISALYPPGVALRIFLCSPRPLDLFYTNYSILSMAFCVSSFPTWSYMLETFISSRGSSSFYFTASRVPLCGCNSVSNLSFLQLGCCKRMLRWIIAYILLYMYGCMGSLSSKTWDCYFKSK